MSAKKKTAKKTLRGGKREGAGRKALAGSRRAVLSVRVTEDAKVRAIAAAAARGITPGELVQAWAESL